MLVGLCRLPSFDEILCFPSTRWHAPSSGRDTTRIADSIISNGGTAVVGSKPRQQLVEKPISKRAIFFVVIFILFACYNNDSIQKKVTVPFGTIVCEIDGQLRTFNFGAKAVKFSIQGT